MKKVSVILSLETFEKIEYVRKKEKIRSFSSMAAKLIEEALEKYEDPDQPNLPL